MMNEQSNAPDFCPECGNHLIGEIVFTGDENSKDGYEEWCYCDNCHFEMFYQLK